VSDKQQAFSSNTAADIIARHARLTFDLLIRFAGGIWPCKDSSN